jgi:hypothetical protein
MTTENSLPNTKENLQETEKDQAPAPAPAQLVSQAEKDEEYELLNGDIYNMPVAPEKKKKNDDEDEDDIIIECSQKETKPIQEKAQEVEEKEEEAFAVDEEEEEEKEPIVETPKITTNSRTKVLRRPHVASKTIPSKAPKRNQKRNIQEVVKSQKNEKIIYISQSSSNNKDFKKAERIINSVDCLSQTDDILECTEYLILDPSIVDKVKDSHIICLLRNVEIITLSTLKDYENGVFKMREIESFPIGEKLNAFEEEITATKANFKKLEIIITVNNPNLVSIITLLKDVHLFNLDEGYKSLGSKHPIYEFYKFSAYQKDESCTCNSDKCKTCLYLKSKPTIYFTFGNRLFYSKTLGLRVGDELRSLFTDMHVNFLQIGNKSKLSKHKLDYPLFMKELIELNHPCDIFERRNNSIEKLLEKLLENDEITTDGITYKIKV